MNKTKDEFFKKLNLHLLYNYIIHFKMQLNYT